MTTLTIEPPAPGQRIAGPRYIAAARSIVPLLRSEAATIEARRELTTVVLDALTEANLFQLLLAPARGEGAVGIADALEILEIIAAGDGSTAWDLSASMGACIMSAYLPEKTATMMFSSPRDSAATAVGRIGKAVAVDGGYVVHARWPFLSGSRHATWIGGLCMVHDGDTPRSSPEGQPHIVVPMLRRERVELLDTWFATGLRGTGSHDAEVSGVFVPEEETVDFARGPRPGLPVLFSIDENAAAPLAAASVAIGIADGAVQAFRSVTRTRPHWSGGMAAQAPLPQLVLARAEGQLDLARGGVRAVAAGIDAELEAGRLPDACWIRRATVTATTAVETAIEAVTSLYRAAGTSAVVSGSVLDRALRDVFTMAAHRTVQRENYLVHGPGYFE